MNGIVKECSDIVETDSPPTRNEVRLDLATTDVNNEISECYCVAPLQSLDGVNADHETLVVKMKIKTRHQFKKEKYSYRRINDEKIAEFVLKLRGVDWERAIRGDSIQEMVSGFDRILVEGLDRTIPKVEKTQKSTDDPWIHDRIRRAIRRRKAVFRLQKRSSLLKSMKRYTDRMIAEAKRRRRQRACGVER